MAETTDRMEVSEAYPLALRIYPYRKSE
uniref:Uncharacterized protein n=1 Tax=Anguilla anguilla TaxID=7936 RepID=A0A0E9TS80_ANGAN